MLRESSSPSAIQGAPVGLRQSTGNAQLHVGEMPSPNNLHPLWNLVVKETKTKCRNHLYPGQSPWPTSTWLLNCIQDAWLNLHPSHHCLRGFDKETESQPY